MLIHEWHKLGLGCSFIFIQSGINLLTLGKKLNKHIAKVSHYSFKIKSYDENDTVKRV